MSKLFNCHICRQLKSVQWRVPGGCFRLYEFLWALGSCLGGVSYDILDPSGLYNPSPISSTEFLQLSLMFDCEFLHLLPGLLNEASVMTIRLGITPWVQKNIFRNHYIDTVFISPSHIWLYFRYLGHPVSGSWGSRKCQKCCSFLRHGSQTRPVIRGPFLQPETDNRKGGISGPDRNLIQGKLPGIYKDNPS